MKDAAEADIEEETVNEGVTQREEKSDAKFVAVTKVVGRRRK